jgi:hypothetical protein
VIARLCASRDIKRELIQGCVKGNSAPADTPDTPGPPVHAGGFFRGLSNSGNASRGSGIGSSNLRDQPFSRIGFD